VCVCEYEREREDVSGVCMRAFEREMARERDGEREKEIYIYIFKEKESVCVRM